MAQLLKILDELEVKAKAATPGPWEYTPEDDIDDWMLVSRANDDYVAIKQDDSGVPIPHDDGHYIAACSPDVILQLCAALREAESVIEFYGNEDEWACAHEHPIDADMGKKARAFLQKWNAPSDRE